MSTVWVKLDGRAIVNGPWQGTPPVDPGWTEIDDGDPRVQAILNPRQPAIRAEFAELDRSIPRGLEDGWAASGFDTATLPAPTRDKLARKQVLRAQLAALIQAGTL